MTETKKDPAVVCPLGCRVRGDAQFVEAVKKWRLDTSELRTVTLERNGLMLENMALKAQLKDVDDLAALVARLAHSMRQAEPDTELATMAVDYLLRKRLIGSPS